MNLKYPFAVRLESSEGEEYFVCEFFDLPGCIGVGDTYNEAIEEAHENLELWLEEARNSGKRIPAPTSTEDRIENFSGKFMTRVGKTLHRNLVRQAKRESISLNALCSQYLSEGLARASSFNTFYAPFAATDIQESSNINLESMVLITEGS